MSGGPAATGGDLLADVMEAVGADCAFGVVSVHNLPLVDAIDRRLRFVPVRHEAAAVNAADGYARVRSGIGVAITSTGTGAGNAAGSLIEALSAGSAVLHVTGQIPSAHLGRRRGVIHETRDQTAMLAAVSRAAFTITPDVTAGAVLRRAASLAGTPPGGPVSVEWPIELQYRRPVDGSPPPRQPLPRPSPRLLTDAAALVSAARRPVLWIGGGGRDAGAPLRRLVDVTGAGVLTSNSGRGVIGEDDERCIGNFAASPACGPLLAAADLLISVGTHFRSNETSDYALALPRPHVQIDVDPDALGRSYPCDVGLAGDAAETVDRLLELFPDRPQPDPGWSEQVRSARVEVRAALRQAIGPQAAICDAMRRALPPGAVIARDVTIPSSSWGNRLLEVYDPVTNVFPRGGGIGQGLAMGIGAAVADPGRPVAVMVGDGGLAVHLGELLTLAQERPWLTVVLFNDGGYGVLRNMQDRHVGRRSGVDLVTPDFRILCRSMRLDYQLVRDVDRFEPALDRALESKEPAVVEVDVAAIGAMPRPFVPPVLVPSGETG